MKGVTMILFMLLAALFTAGTVNAQGMQIDRPYPGVFRVYLVCEDVAPPPALDLTDLPPAPTVGTYVIPTPLPYYSSPRPYGYYSPTPYGYTGAISVGTVQVNNVVPNGNRRLLAGVQEPPALRLGR